MNSWKLLRKIVGKRAMSSYDVKYNYNSPRFKTISHHLPKDSTIDKYSNDSRANIYAKKLFNPELKTIIFLAHHDVAEPKFHNVLDNTASISNMIELFNRLQNKELSINVIMAFSDGEELANFVDPGSVLLAKKIKNKDFGEVLEVINLELTAFGDYIWGSGNSNILKTNYEIVNVGKIPFSDTSVMLKNGIPSTCLGLFSHEDFEQVIKTGTCDTWELCHEKQDKFKLAKRKDMSMFVDFLEEYVLRISSSMKM